MSADMFAFLLGAGAGGAVVWYFKDTLVKWVVGVEAFVTSLEAKVAALKATVTPVVPPKA